MTNESSTPKKAGSWSDERCKNLLMAIIQSGIKLDAKIIAPYLDMKPHTLYCQINKLEKELKAAGKVIGNPDSMGTPTTAKLAKKKTVTETPRKKRKVEKIESQDDDEDDDIGGAANYLDWFGDNKAGEEVGKEKLAPVEG
jgi:hypothetical protein